MVFMQESASCSFCKQASTQDVTTTYFHEREREREFTAFAFVLENSSATASLQESDVDVGPHQHKRSDLIRSNVGDPTTRIVWKW